MLKIRIIQATNNLSDEHASFSAVMHNLAILLFGPSAAKTVLDSTKVPNTNRQKSGKLQPLASG